MDALSLALTTNAASTLGAGAADNTALAEDGNGAAIDFATLLAAGMLPAEAALDPAAQAALDNAASLSEEHDALAPDALADAALAMQSPLQAGFASHAIAIGQNLAEAGQGLDAGGHLAVAQKAGNAAAALAAEAATFAAQAAAGTQHEALFDAAALAAAATESASAAELAAHTLNVHPAEQRPAAQPTAVLNVAAPVSGEGFADALSQQVVWMVDKDAQVAELHINPPELGPVEVRLKISGDEASAHFVSAHAEVRSAIEAALGRLREAMSQAGVQLGETSVSSESFRDQASAHADARESRKGYGDERNPADSAWAARPVVTRTHRGLIDLFA